MFQWLMLGLFVALLLGSGIYSMRKTKTVNDFFLGNRGVGPWMSAFAFGTTYFSAVLFIGYAGKVGWGFGLSALWIAVGNTFIGSLLAWWILAKRTRQMTVRLDARTMPEFLESRYGVTTFMGAKLDTPLVGSLAMLCSLAVVPIVSLATSPLPAGSVAKAFGTAAEDVEEVLQPIGEEMSM